MAETGKVSNAPPGQTRAAPEMAVPLQDLSRDQHSLAGELEVAVRRVFESSEFVLGTFLERFEAEIARYVGIEHAVGVASGSDALLLALKALGIGPGDEVITTPLSFIATASSIVHAGATPVFADIRADTYNLDPSAVAAVVSDKTAAILPVHLHGQMADMSEIRALATRHGLAVIEDAAQAIGATQTKRDPEHRYESPSMWRAGAAGDAGCFSFYPSKNLGGWGDGGLVTTGDARTAEQLRALRNHGQGRTSGAVPILGYNSRLDAIQAAVLGVKLQRLDEWTSQRRAHAAWYDQALVDVKEVDAPVVAPENGHVFHHYTVSCSSRDTTTAALDRDGIEHRVYHPTLHRMAAFENLGYRAGDFPIAERAAEKVLSLPMFPSLTAEEREQVVGALRSAADTSAVV
jgi:dTDP-4-amino-4,6-dideoxygalactose transaminase